MYIHFFLSNLCDRMQLMSLTARNVLEIGCEIPSEPLLMTTSAILHNHHGNDDNMDEDKRDMMVTAFLQQQDNLIHHDHYNLDSQGEHHHQGMMGMMSSNSGQDPDLIPLSSKVLMYHHHNHPHHHLLREQEEDGNNSSSSLTSSDHCQEHQRHLQDQSRLHLLRNTLPTQESISQLFGQQQQDNSSGQQEQQLDIMSGLLGPPPEVVMNANTSVAFHLKAPLEGLPEGLQHQMSLETTISGYSHHHLNPNARHHSMQAQPLQSILKTSGSFPQRMTESSSHVDNVMSGNSSSIVLMGDNDPPTVYSTGNFPTNFTSRNFPTNFSTNSYSSPSSSASSSSFQTSKHYRQEQHRQQLQQQPYNHYSTVPSELEVNDDDNDSQGCMQFMMEMSLWLCFCFVTMIKAVA